MSGPIAWSVELEVLPGQHDAFVALTAEMVEHARSEPGVLVYDRFVDADLGTVHIYERYADSASAVRHLSEFGSRFAARFHPMVRRKRFLVFGDPAPDLRKTLDRYGATYARPLASRAAPPEHSD